MQMFNQTKIECHRTPQVHNAISQATFLFYHSIKAPSIARMEIEENDDDEVLSIKAEDDVKRESQHHSAPHEKVQNSPEIQMVELNSECGDKESNYKFERNEVSQRLPRTIDLSKEILSGIVKHCRKEDLISEELAHCFSINYTTKMETLYIEYYKTNQLYRFDFAKSKINIIDHRRLTQMLLSHNPTKYLPVKEDGPYDFLKQGREFLKDIYSLPPEEYQRITEEQVNRYYQTWWGGPENLNPGAVEPAVEVLDVEEACKQREQAERAQRLQQQEAEQEMLLRVSQQTATKNDLLDIANRISSQLFGKFSAQKDAEVKFEDELQPEQDKQSSTSKRKKNKADKKDHKDKKQKKKSKKKKAKADTEVKKQWIEDIKAKKEAEDAEDLGTLDNNPAKRIKAN